MKLLFEQTEGLSQPSLTTLCAHLSKQQVYMTKEGLNQRFNEKTVCFLRTIFQCLFAQQSTLSLAKMPMKTHYPFTRIRILDGTSIKLPATCFSTYPSTVGAGVKFQVEFDYLTGSFPYIELQAGKADDCPSGMKRLETVEKGDLLLQDLGYFQYKLFQKIDEKEAFFISHARVDTTYFVDHLDPPRHPDGRIRKMYAYERLYLEKEWSTLKQGEMREYPRVYLGKEEKLPTRLNLYRFTKKEQQRQEYRIKRRAQTKPGQIKQKSKALSGISTLITNLPQEITAKEVVQLYRYRWQIELLFKTWKSDFKASYFRKMKQARWECHLYAELIILLISTLFAYQFRIYFWQEKQILLSERLTMRAIQPKIGVLWRARDQPSWQSTLQEIECILFTIGRKRTTHKP